MNSRTTQLQSAEADVFYLIPPCPPWTREVTSRAAKAAGLHCHEVIPAIRRLTERRESDPDSADSGRGLLHSDPKDRAFGSASVNPLPYKSEFSNCLI
jgi:hypothetical protein